MGGALVLPILMLLSDIWNEVLMDKISVNCNNKKNYEILGKNYWLSKSTLIRASKFKTVYTI